MSPFYLVLYIFIGLILLICVVSFVMHLERVCGACCACGEKSSSYSVDLDQQKPLSHLETTFIVPDVGADDNSEANIYVCGFDRKQDILQHHYDEQCNKTDEKAALSYKDGSENKESDKLLENNLSHPDNQWENEKHENNVKKTKPPVAPKPALLVEIHSLPSSQRNSTASTIDSKQGSLGLPSSQRNSTVSTLDSKQGSLGRNISPPKRKAPPPPPSAQKVSTPVN